MDVAITNHLLSDEPLGPPNRSERFEKVGRVGRDARYFEKALRLAWEISKEKRGQLRLCLLAKRSGIRLEAVVDIIMCQGRDGSGFAVLHPTPNHHARPAIMAKHSATQR